MRTPKPKEPPKMQPPMTPMIDCTFNLLIFFLLTPSFSLTEGFLTTNLPTTSGPVAGREQITVQRIKVQLTDAGDQGTECVITFAESVDLGSDFEALFQQLDQKYKSGIAANTPVLISPTMRCRHKWVVKAFDQAVKAHFTEIHFAVPYE
jgi:biopolymer transport protein ExbD